jgi:PIN domain nuclease of toxin-antitoxin system
MNILLDTHAFVWFMNADDRFPKHLINDIENFENTCYLSMASLWEMAIKVNLGKLELIDDFENILEFCSSNRIVLLPIEFEDTRSVIGLPDHHRDPFDRMLIVQANSQDAVVFTKDRMFEKYDVQTSW